MTTSTSGARPVHIAIAGVGNCAGSLVEGVQYYRQHSEDAKGLLFPILGGRSVSSIRFVLAFDVSAEKVGQTLGEAIYKRPNNFVRNGIVANALAPVFRGPTLDGNPDHLAVMVPESSEPPADVPALLKAHRVDVLVSLLPTGSHQATRFYADAALEAGCAFINCTPSIVAQDLQIRKSYEARGLPLLGDDIKSQVGTTILHRALLQMLAYRGANLLRTTQVNIGGNTDFANFVHRADSKLVSKRKSLKEYTAGAQMHVGHHYDPTQGALKHAIIEIEASVFGGSPVNISVQLNSDDKPNAAGSICDLIRIAKAAMEREKSGIISEVCAFYMKSPPGQIADFDAYEQVTANWAQ